MTSFSTGNHRRAQAFVRRYPRIGCTTILHVKAQTCHRGTLRLRHTMGRAPSTELPHRIWVPMFPINLHSNTHRHLVVKALDTRTTHLSAGKIVSLVLLDHQRNYHDHHTHHQAQLLMRRLITLNLAYLIIIVLLILMGLQNHSQTGHILHFTSKQPPK